jgi:hypothetical protein
MVDMIKCDHCGVEFNPKYAVKKEFDGVTLSFCCRGCLQVYELMREENAAPSRNNIDKKITDQ